MQVTRHFHTKFHLYLNAILPFTTISIKDSFRWLSKLTMGVLLFHDDIIFKITLSMTCSFPLCQISGCWQKFCPKTNVHWLRFLAELTLVEDWKDARMYDLYTKLNCPPCLRHQECFDDGISVLDLSLRRRDILQLLSRAASASHFVRMARLFVPYLFGPRHEAPHTRRNK